MNPAVIDFINTNRDRYLEELKQYLAIPSVSALPDHAIDVRRCAEWTADHMRQIGLQNVRVIDTPGHPVVYGDWLNAPGAPTVLFYGHYDVQPVDPLDLWTTPPFEATVRDDELFARGATDDKGQLFVHLKAIEAHLKRGGRPAHQRARGPRGRGGDRQPEPEPVHPGAQGRTGLRRRGHLGLPDVRQGRAVDLLRPARPVLLPDRPAGHEHRPALGLVRGRGGQPGVRPRAGAVADEGPRRPREDSRVLRRRAGADGPGARGVQAPAVQREAVQEAAGRAPGCTARPGTRRSSASGRAPPSR